MWTSIFSGDFGTVVLRPFDTPRQSLVLVVYLLGVMAICHIWCNCTLLFCIIFFVSDTILNTVFPLCLMEMGNLPWFKKKTYSLLLLLQIGIRNQMISLCI
jgi:hypothetical protein